MRNRETEEEKNRDYRETKRKRNSMAREERQRNGKRIRLSEAGRKPGQGRGAKPLSYGFSLAHVGGMNQVQLCDYRPGPQTSAPDTLYLPFL